jgi:hypothetical protein
MTTEEVLKQFIGNEFTESNDLLGATAKGTEENFYLDPIPRLNKLGYIYSNIITDIGARISARTDSIKMNRDNMDYTNDGENGGKIYDLSIVSAYDLNNDGVIGFDDANILLAYYAYKQTTISPIEEYFDLIFSQKIDVSEVSELPPELINYKEKYSGDYPNRTIANINKYSYFYPKKGNSDNDYYYLFMYQNDSDENTLDYYKNLFSDKLAIIEKYESGNALGASSILKLIKDEGKGNPYITVKQLADNFGFYKTQSFLNLLMPQYKRRVEVEDLDENFWVIGQVLDAVVNSIFGKNNIIDILMNIIDRLNDIDIQINLINKMIGLGDDVSIQLRGPSIVSSSNLFSFESIYPRITTGYGYRDISTPFSNRVTSKYYDEESATSFSNYCIQYNREQYDAQSTASYFTNIRSDMLFYGKKDGITESFGKFRSYLNSNVLDDEQYLGELMKINSAYLLPDEEMNVLIINMNDYKISEKPASSSVTIQERDNDDSKFTFNNTIIVHNNNLYGKEIILIALGTSVSKYSNENTGLNWSGGNINQLPLCVAHSEAYGYSNNSYYVLKDSKMNYEIENNKISFKNDNKGFKAYYFKPKQSKIKSAKNSENIYNPGKSAQIIDSIEKDDIFTQRFYICQGNGDYIDYQYLHGHMTYFGAGSTVSSDFAEHGLIGFLSRDNAKMVSDSKNSIIYFNKNNKLFEEIERETWSNISGKISEKFAYIINNSIPDGGFSEISGENGKSLNDHKTLLQLCRNISLNYRSVLPVFFYSSMVTQPFISMELTGFKFSAKPRDAFYRTANNLCIIPIFSNGKSGGNVLDIGLNTETKISSENLQCFEWNYINSEDIGNGNISNILYRYAYAKGKPIISATPYHSTFKYLVGYLFIFANTGSSKHQQKDVDINDFQLYGTVDNNDMNLFTNGTNITKGEVTVAQSWG